MAVWPDEAMPVDQFGTRAELIRDGTSVTKRMNSGCLYEQYFNAQSDAMRRRLASLKKDMGDAWVSFGWDLMLHYWSLVSPKTETYYRMMTERINKKAYLEDLIGDGLYHWFPTENPITLLDAVRNLEREYPLASGPVRYRDLKGRMITTKRNVIIASVYAICLEKTGKQWSSVASTKLSHFGLPAKVSRSAKYTTPARVTPVRELGESETRVCSAMAGGEVIARIIEMSTSPRLHSHMVRNILGAPKPTAIENTVTDPNLINRGGRNVAFLHHALEVGGVKLYRTKDDRTEPTIYPPLEGEHTW